MTYFKIGYYRSRWLCDLILPFLLLVTHIHISWLVHIHHHISELPISIYISIIQGCTKLLFLRSFELIFFQTLWVPLFSLCLSASVRLRMRFWVTSAPLLQHNPTGDRGEECKKKGFLFPRHANHLVVKGDEYNQEMLF